MVKHYAGAEQVLVLRRNCLVPKMGDCCQRHGTAGRSASSFAGVVLAFVGGEKGLVLLMLL